MKTGPRFRGISTLLRSCGFNDVIYRTNNTVDFKMHMSQVTWQGDTFAVLRPMWFPGLVYESTGNDQYDYVEAEVKTSRVEEFLLSMIQRTEAAGHNRADLRAALDLYHTQCALVEWAVWHEGLEAPGMAYTFDDCLHLAACGQDLRTLIELVRLQVPVDVMRQIWGGGQAASIMLELYAGKVV